jgi:AcrR family transcriptional regulator
MYHRPVKPRLLDAAEATFDRLGLRATIDDIAREAGVSRATVYRHVRDRDELVLAVFAREADRLLARMAAAGATSLVEGVLFAVREVPSTPFLVEVMRDPPAGAWEVCVDRAHGHLGDDPVMIEWVLRMVLSLLTIPVARSDAELRAFVERVLPAAVRSER